MDGAIIKTKKAGRLTGIIGPMFAGKTTEMKRRIDRDKIAGKAFRIFKPEVDNRYSTYMITTHNFDYEHAIVLKDTRDILMHIESKKPMPGETFYFDELQFLSSSIIGAVQAFVANGINVTYTMLPAISEGRPFPFKDGKKHAGDLLALHHDEIVHLVAVCTSCGNEAAYTFYMKGRKDAVLVGGTDDYTALCSQCYWEKTGGEQALSNMRQMGDEISQMFAETNNICRNEQCLQK